MFKIIYFEKRSGRKPVLDFIDSLEKKAQAIMLSDIEELAIVGDGLMRPKADSVKGKIRELRSHYLKNRYRILHYFYYKEYIVLVHAFQKKTSAIEKKDIEIAEKRIKEFEYRIKEGTFRL